ncbi:CLUMA_CG011696, isoform A [Clunio marinus]|uniref:CLUMA_CG011696, isoform A n=1 Tax=Clunio marinus TaxID=568069 RepID=A0A1J1IH21_9DIPT|nr:CLUMA_CG011696, isoform A [Clunio marinus]
MQPISCSNANPKMFQSYSVNPRMMQLRMQMANFVNEICYICFGIWSSNIQDKRYDLCQHMLCMEELTS